LMLESVAVVHRRGRDIRPCTRGFGGAVCRVGGKLRSIRPLPVGRPYTGGSQPCLQITWEELPSGLFAPAHCYPVTWYRAESARGFLLK
jgi:hypothetical protein